MHPAKGRRADFYYLLLAALFITALVVCNLVANKFVEIDLGFKTFIISVGILPYPITFLITDILSEVYGQRRTNAVVYAGFGALIFTLLVIWLGGLFPAIAGSPLGDAAYGEAFGNTWRLILASMAAYLVAQLIDVKLFHFWKNLTGGKHLWVRNNGSTILSQLVDTTLVIVVLFAGSLSWGTMGQYILDGWLFKALVALADTPFMYAAAWFFRRTFSLAEGEELPARY